jgi:hypothetical protein
MPFNSNAFLASTMSLALRPPGVGSSSGPAGGLRGIGDRHTF